MPKRGKHSRRSKKNLADSDSDNSTLVDTPDPIEVNNIFHWDGSTQGLLGLAHGSAGMVFVHSDYTVVKVYLGRDVRSIENSAIERQAYRNLQREGVFSEHVLRCYDIENPYGLLLERCRETVRQRIRSPDYSPDLEAFSLARQATEGLAYVHRCGIRQGDVGCHNMLLDYQGRVKIADFAGSSVKWSGFASSVAYEVGSKLPGHSEPTERTDIFALGSAIYEMITHKPPYHGLPYGEVQNRFKQGIFPDEFGSFLDLGSVIERCWGKRGRFYANAEEVLEALARLSITDGAPCYHTLPEWRPAQSNLPPTPPESVRDFSPETSQPAPRISHPEKGTYVNYLGNEKEIRKPRMSRRPKRHSQRKDTRAGKANHTQNYSDGPIGHLVHMLQSLGLFADHPRSLSYNGKIRH